MSKEISKGEEIRLPRYIYNLFIGKPLRLYGLLKRKIPVQRILNAGLCFVSLVLKTPRALGYPMGIVIETNNICNLRCPLCPTGRNALTRPKGNMPFERFKKIVDELHSSLLEVTISNYGEPLLNKELYKMIRYANEKRVKTIVGTNAVLFKGREDIRKLIATNLDYLIVSVDGASQETYVKYRKGGDFRKVIENMQMIIEERKKMGKSTPFVELQFIVMKQNEHEIPKIRKIADEIGADCLALKMVYFNNADWDNEEVIDLYRSYVPSDEKYRDYIVTEDSIRWKEEVRNTCRALWRTPVIFWDGSINPCCLDPHGELTMGHVDEGIKKVWNNSKYRKLRRQVAKDKKKIPLCARCPGE